MKKWMGIPPKKCQVCDSDLLDFWVDGKVGLIGMWGHLCLDCHRKYGYGLGIGRGQKYSVKTLEKIEG